MQDQFVSFENYNNHSSAWIPRVFSHLRKKSESIPTDIDSSGLHILTSFAPWGSSTDVRKCSTSSIKSTRKKSKSADSILIDQVPSSYSSQEYPLAISSQVIRLSSSRQSLHARSSSLPATLGESLPDYFKNLLSQSAQQRENETKGPNIKLGDSHSVMFHGEGFAMYTIYMFELELITSESVQKFKIKKRFSEFKDLYNNLLKIYGIKLPSFPHKAFIGNFYN